ncbi:hypothetical protein QBC47DRAFT_78339 [Echria macrotheca]|uniref:Uncharacterized protein n=1 Tax=Echria macrotheca TaxID=438768 RepID=A0AAJ0B701_9PEZI|nr:hypothetical protein QBC47DRAFT_78339 [Echria macrotheca]
MEMQPPSESTQTQTDLSAEHQDTAPPRHDLASSKGQDLLFPSPRVNQQLANYISESSPEIRQAVRMSESGMLADSAYEFISNTDGESQDGQLSESTGSLDISRPDDIHSLDGSDGRYNSDSDDEHEHSSHASSIRYADQALQSPSRHISASNSEYRTAQPDTIKSPDVSEVRGDADESSLAGTISASHVIREYTEEEAAELAKQLKLPTDSQRLVTVVRQTMSPAHLSTKDPLRVLYVGRAAAKRDIIKKLSTAIWASSENTKTSGDAFGGQPEEIYNIVPISGFGSSPELELMEGSQYLIKVEHCTSAIEHNKGRDGNGTTYSITIGHDLGKTYKTSNRCDGAVIQPQWTLPHIAVFFCSANEDADEVQTRRAAWEFMHVHNVPSILVSEMSMIDVWEERINEDTAHLGIESRDAQGCVLLRRFPIDLASFLNIPAKQMNRNLAFLTGLTEPTGLPDGARQSKAPSQKASSLADAEDVKRKEWNLEQFFRAVDEYEQRNQWGRQLLSFIALMIFAPYLVLSLFNWGAGKPPMSMQPAAVVESLGLTSTPVITPTTKATQLASTSTTTVVISVTSTKTVEIASAQPSTSSMASVLSFGGLLSDKPSASPVEPEVKKTICVVHVHGPNELLVEMPSGSKAAWLAKGAIDIDVYRGSERVKTKLSSVDEGILVELAQKDAYGVLNVSVVTSRKPKINETFEVDFGKTVAAEIFEAGMHLLKDISNLFSGAGDVGDGEKTAKSKEDVDSSWRHVLGTGKQQYDEAVDRVKNSLGPGYQRAMEEVSRKIEAAKSLQREADKSILRAQIASRLWWLKMRGKVEESVQYERNASLFLKAKYAAAATAGATTSGKKAVCTGPKESREKEGGWRKLIMG